MERTIIKPQTAFVLFGMVFLSCMASKESAKVNDKGENKVSTIDGQNILEESPNIQMIRNVLKGDWYFDWCGEMAADFIMDFHKEAIVDENEMRKLEEELGMEEGDLGRGYPWYTMWMHFHDNDTGIIRMAKKGDAPKVEKEMIYSIIKKRKDYFISFKTQDLSFKGKLLFLVEDGFRVDFGEDPIQELEKH